MNCRDVNYFSLYIYTSYRLHGSTPLPASPPSNRHPSLRIRRQHEPELHRLRGGCCDLPLVPQQQVPEGDFGLVRDEEAARAGVAAVAEGEVRGGGGDEVGLRVRVVVVVIGGGAHAVEAVAVEVRG